MAWTEQCKVAFHANCCAKLGRFRNKNRKLRGILRELSQESGIPWRTLERWWYEQTNQDPNPRKNEGDKKLPQSGIKHNYSQATIWKRTEKKLRELCAYMGANCETPADIDEGLKTKVKNHIDFLTIYRNDL